MKSCKICQQEKEFSEFHFVLSKPRKCDGLVIKKYMAKCKCCQKEHNNLRYKTDPALRERMIMQRQQNYRKDPQKYIKKLIERINRRKKVDKNFKLLTICRSRLNSAIGKDYGTKAHRTMNLIGCTTRFLKKYVESRFLPGMTWDNYGAWQLDHILPCAAFDLRDETQQRACFNWQNIRPMWTKDNALKTDYLPNGERTKQSGKIGMSFVKYDFSSFFRTTEELFSDSLYYNFS